MPSPVKPIENGEALIRTSPIKPPGNIGFPFVDTGSVSGLLVEPCNSYNALVSLNVMNGQRFVYQPFISGTITPDIWSDIWSGSPSALFYTTDPDRVAIKSDDASDTFDGNGLKQLYIQGVDDEYVERAEIIDLNGTDYVLTLNVYLRINKMLGITCGNVGYNAGTIRADKVFIQDDEILFNEGILCEMPPLTNTSLSSAYTIPAGFTGHISKLIMRVPTTAPMQIKAIERRFDFEWMITIPPEVVEDYSFSDVEYSLPLIPPGTDIKLQMNSYLSVAPEVVSGSYILLLRPTDRSVDEFYDFDNLPVATEGLPFAAGYPTQPPATNTNGGNLPGQPGGPPLP